jgi:hypothetical protein
MVGISTTAFCSLLNRLTPIFKLGHQLIMELDDIKNENFNPDTKSI